MFLRATLLAFSLLLASLCQPVHAQSAAVSGLVLDPSGASVPHAQITFTNERTGDVQRSKTNGVGMYSLPFVHPGRYSLSAEAAGFKRFEENAITVETAQNLALDVKLQVGSVNETVTVSGSGVWINTTNGSVSTVVDRQFVENMPLNGRSFQDLISLTPGVVTQNPQMASVTSSQLGVIGDFSVNGQRTESNNYIVDGVSANSSGTTSNGVASAGILPAKTVLGTTQSLISVDALQEFRVLSSSYSAEYGRTPGGQFIFTTRSGTNHFHGGAYDYLRNNFFDANDWFNDHNGVAQTALRQNDFGGFLGGPISIPKLYDGKDKTFFFLSYEGLRLMLPQAASTQYVPSNQLRSAAPTYLQSILNTFPVPTGPDILVSGNDSGLAPLVKAYSLPDAVDSTSLRIDHRITSKMSAFFRYGYTPSVENGRALSVVTRTRSDNKSYTFGATNQLTNRINNSFRLGYAHSVSAAFSTFDSFGGASPIALASYMGGDPSLSPYALFSLSIPGVGSTRLGSSNSNIATAQWNAVDTFSMLLGHHQLTFGADYRHIVSPPASTSREYVQALYFSRAAVVNNTTGSFSLFKYINSEPVFNDFSLFAQDDWHVAPRLTFSFGLRWDVDPPPTGGNGLDAFTLTASSNLGDPSSLQVAPRGTRLWKTTYFNFSPRLGVAWQTRTNPGWETVIRAGGGVFYDTDNLVGVNGFGGLGFSAHVSETGKALPATPAEFDFNPSTVAPYTTSVIYDFPSHLQLPYTLQWNAAVQQALGRSQTLTMSYVGSAGRRLLDIQQDNLSSLNSNFGTVFFLPRGITSDYHALQVQFQRSVSRGIQALASYTWAHSIDIGSTTHSLPPSRGNSDYDLRHTFQVGLTWNLPNVNGNQITRYALSHWAVDGRLMVRSGFPVAIEGSELTDPYTGDLYYGGVNLVKNQPIYLHGSQYPGGRAINKGAFCDPTQTKGATSCAVMQAAGSMIGNALPRNTVRGFGENQINFAVRREFPIKDNLKLQFRAEAFNILNHPNFGNIDATLGDSTFGQAQSMLNTSLETMASLYQQGGSRSMQFMLKVMF